jgi:hypothetical protein
MHTIGNVIGNTLLLSGLVRLHPGQELSFSPGAEGVVSIVLMLALGYWLHRRRASRSSAPEKRLGDAVRA